MPLQALMTMGVHTPIHATSHAECDNVNTCTLTDTHTHSYILAGVHMQEHADPDRCAHYHMYNYSCRVITCEHVCTLTDTHTCTEKPQALMCVYTQCRTLISAHVCIHTWENLHTHIHTPLE